MATIVAVQRSIVTVQRFRSGSVRARLPPRPQRLRRRRRHLEPYVQAPPLLPARTITIATTTRARYPSRLYRPASTAFVDQVKTEVKSPAPSEDFIVVREQSIGGGAPPSEVPVEAPEVAELTEIGCEDGEFLDASNTCQVCDAHCNVDRCIDGMGCLACYAGYYYVRPEAGKPFECRQCTIPHCVDCQDGATDDGQTPKCIQCENGYRLASDSRVCYPIVPPSPVTEQITTPAPIVDEQQPVTIVDEQEPATIADEKEPAAIRTGSSQTEDSTTETSIETEAPSACPGNSFMSIADNGCVKCDMHAIPGGCKDYIGCLGCMRGFFRRRAASNYPFSCYPCTIANCAVCEDDIPFYAPLKCRACENTYQVDERTGLCVPV